MIEYIGRTAYNSEKIATLIADNIGALVKAHSSSLRVASPVPPHLTDLDNSAVVACPSCMAELDILTVHKGSNRCPHCSSTFTAE